MDVKKLNEPFRLAPLVAIDSLTLFKKGKTGHYMSRADTLFVERLALYYRLHIFYKKKVIHNLWKPEYHELIAQEHFLKIQEWEGALKELKCPLIIFGEGKHLESIKDSWTIVSPADIKIFNRLYGSWELAFHQTGKGQKQENERRGGNNTRNTRGQNTGGTETGIKYKF